MVIAALAGVALLALLPATAAADGLPAAGIDARPLFAPGGDVDYTTARAGAETRLVESARYGGPLRVRRLAGSLSVPAVAYDGSPGGISADGRMLVLISPRTRYPRSRTTFAVVDARRLSIRRRISLRGDFSVDALSPDGRTMYLIQYSPRDLADYSVRVYDLRAGRLRPDPVVDPREPGEPLTGIPVTRATSAEGRWAYTLYNSDPHPFVHALDMERRTAVRIDLDGVGGSMWGATLQLHGPRLDVVGERGTVLASIDTRGHDLVELQVAPAEDAGTSWLPMLAPAGVLAVIVALRRRRRIARTPRLRDA